MCESMLLVFKDYIGWLFWMMSGLLYFAFVFIALELSHQNIRWVLRQLNRAEDERWNVMAALLVRKLKVLRLYQFTIFLYLLLEVSLYSQVLNINTHTTIFSKSKWTNPCNQTPIT